MKKYKFIYDSGDIYYEYARSPKIALHNHCVFYVVPKEWVLKHCEIVDMGKVEKTRIPASDDED